MCCTGVRNLLVHRCPQSLGSMFRCPQSLGVLHRCPQSLGSILVSLLGVQAWQARPEAFLPHSGPRFLRARLVECFTPARPVECFTLARPVECFTPACRSPLPPRVNASHTTCHVGARKSPCPHDLSHVPVRSVKFVSASIRSHRYTPIRW